MKKKLDYLWCFFQTDVKGAGGSEGAVFPPSNTRSPERCQDGKDKPA